MAQLPLLFPERTPMPKGRYSCQECQQLKPSGGPCECSMLICDDCRHHGAHAGCWLLHDRWVKRMRAKLLLLRKPGQGLAVTKDGPKMHLGGRPQKQYSPIMGRDLNKFLSGIASQQERSVIGHGTNKGY